MTSFEKEYYEQPKLWKEDLLNLPSEFLRISTIISLIPSDVRTILDAGCGNGAFLNALPYTYEST
jgi:SAM-dependent methyltransferase